MNPDTMPKARAMHQSLNDPEVTVRPLWRGRQLGLAVLFLASTSGLAQAQDKYDLGLGVLGGASVEASVVQVENYFYEPSNGVSATGYRVRPAVNLSRASSIGLFAVDANLEQSNFDLPGKLDEYLDYAVGGSYSWQPFTRHRFDLEGTFRRGHDAAGLIRTEAGADFSQGVNDRWNNTGGYATYRYGAGDSLGSNTIRIGQSKRTYQTNRNQTVFLDFNTRVVDYELAYEYSPKTAVIFAANYKATDYARPVISSLGNRNGNELSLRTGLRWIATGKTSGEVQVGVRDYSVDGRMRPARQSLAWKANINWAPTRTAKLSFNTGQTTSETFRSDTFFIDERSVGLNWNQTWTQRLSTNAGARYINSKFVGLGREDEYVGLSIGADYLLMRKFTVFAQYLARDRTSDLALRDYDAPEARLGLRWTL